MSKILIYHNDIQLLSNGEYVSPVTCEVDLTNRCQLDCSFCFYKKYRSEQPADLPFLTAIDLFTSLKQCGVKTVTLTGGGEPTLHKRFQDIATAAYSIFDGVGLITNGVNLDLVFPALFRFIRVSLDASNPEMYRKIKGADHFDRVISGIKNIKNRSTKTTIGVSYIVSQESESGKEEAVSLFEDIGIDYWQFKPVVIVGKKIKTISSSVDRQKEIHTQRYLPSGKLPCTIAGLVGVVGATGDVYYCCQHRGNPAFVIGNVNHEDFSKIWRRRIDMDMDTSNCPPCRYMNYAKEFKNIAATERHTDFL